MPTAIAFSRYGGPDVLHSLEIEEPSAAAGQVRVRVRAAGVTPLDTKIRAGALREVFPVTFPARLGNEFAGVIDQVGPDVTDFAVGDEVLGYTFAEAYAEVILASVNQIAIRPADLPWEVAGALPVAGQGAYHFIQELGVDAGDTFLIHAAAGAVGTLASQLAIQRGATVIGTASEANHDYLRSLGVVPVSYGDELVGRVRAVAPLGVSVALDAIGGAATDASVELVADRDRIGSLVDPDPAIAKYGIRRLVGGRSPQTLRVLAELAAKGTLRLPVTAFPLGEAAAAHRRVEHGHGRGKVVLTNE